MIRSKKSKKTGSPDLESSKLIDTAVTSNSNDKQQLWNNAEIITDYIMLDSQDIEQKNQIKTKQFNEIDNSLTLQKKSQMSTQSSIDDLKFKMGS